MCAGTLARQGIAIEIATEFLIWDFTRQGRQKPELTAISVITILCIQTAFGGCCEWVLDDVCKTFEWLSAITVRLPWPSAVT